MNMRELTEFFVLANIHDGHKKETRDASSVKHLNGFEVGSGERVIDQSTVPVSTAIKGGIDTQLFGFVVKEIHITALFKKMQYNDSMSEM